MRKCFANATSSSWNAEAPEPTSSWRSRTSKVTLTLTRLNSTSAHPEPDYEAHLPIAARTKPSSTQERCLFSSSCEILEQTSGTFSLVTLGIYLVNGLKFSCSIYVISAPFSFSMIFCSPGLFTFPLPSNSDHRGQSCHS